MPCHTPSHRIDDSVLRGVTEEKNTKKAEQRRIQTMYISLSLFVFSFMGSSAQKQGDFGIFTACIKNGSLRLDCYYASCTKSPSFKCEFKTSSGVTIAEESDDRCKYLIPNQGPLYANRTLSYKCTLKRRNRIEEKQLIVDFSIRKGKRAIKPCPGTTGLLLHQAPAVLWPGLTLSLWRLLVPDRHTT